jgi:hypothetical protein
VRRAGHEAEGHEVADDVGLDAYYATVPPKCRGACMHLIDLQISELHLHFDHFKSTLPHCLLRAKIPHAVKLTENADIDCLLERLELQRLQQTTRLTMTLLLTMNAADE